MRLRFRDTLRPVAAGNRGQLGRRAGLIPGIVPVLGGLALALTGCPPEKGPQMAPDLMRTATDGGPADGATRSIFREPPEVLLRAAALALRQSDEKSAKTLVDMALSSLGGAAITLEPALGLREPEAIDKAGEGRGTGSSSTAVLVDLSPTMERLAIGHGRLLSLIETEAGYEVRRLGLHPAPIAALRLSRARREGSHVVTLAQDRVVRLVPTNGGPPKSFPVQPPLAKEPLTPGAERDIADEAPHRAAYIDFSPDGSLLFIADCQESAPACPPRRLRVVDVGSGAVLQELSGPGELVEYTPRRDGTVALLWSGQAPQLVEARRGAVLPLSPPPWNPTKKPAPEVVAAVHDCMERTLPPLDRMRPWLVSPERDALLTQARPGLLCLWDLKERSLRQAIEAAGLGLRSKELRLDSLLSEGTAAVLSQRTGPTWASELVAIGRSQPRAALGRVLQTMPLDGGGALITAIPPGAASTTAPRGAAALTLWRLSEGLPLQRFAVTERLLGARAAGPPDSVSGDGRLVVLSLDSAQGPGAALVALPPLPSRPAGQQPARPADPTPRSAPLPHSALLPLAGRIPLAYADFIEDGQLLLAVDTEGSAAVLELGAARPTEATPRFRIDSSAPRLTSLRFSPDGDQLFIGLGAVRVPLWLSAGRLREPEAVSPPGPHDPRDPLAPATSPVEAVSPDGRLRVRGDAAGGVLFFATGGAGPGRKDELLLRLQVLPGGLGAVALAQGRPPAQPGGFELLGSVPSPGDYVVCRAGALHLAYGLCAPRQARPGLVRQALQAVH